MKVAMFIDNNFTLDQRVIREAKSVASFGYDLCVYAFYDKDLPREEIKDNYVIKRILNKNILKARNKKYIEQTVQQINESFDVVHCHDHHMLQLAAGYKKHYPNCKLIYDSHELFKAWPLNLLQGVGLRLKIKTLVVRYMDIVREKSEAKQVDFLITVNDSIAAILKKYFNLKNEPVVLRNTLDFEEIKLKSDYLRNEFNIPRGKKIIAYIALHIYRKKLNIESAILQLGNLPDVAIVIISAESFDRKYFEELVKSENFTNIYFKKPIQRSEFVPIIGSADMGLITTWNKKSLSYWLALDNKLFTYVICELPILATAQPEYINIIEKYKIGVCVNGDEPDCFKTGLQELIKNYAVEKENVTKLKYELNWGTEQEKLRQLYSKIKASL